MKKAVKHKRAYRSEHRAQQAEETRQRVLEAARKVFIARGFAGTTMVQVAEEAGVSVETVYAGFGTKAELLASAVRALLVVGGKAPHQTQGAEAVRAEPDPRQHIALFAEHISTLIATVSPIFDVVASTRREPEIGELYKRMQKGRFENLRAMIGWLDEKNGLRKGLAPDAAAETVWALASAEVYRALTQERGWTREQFAAWLTDSLSRLLLP